MNKGLLDDFRAAGLGRNLKHVPMDDMDNVSNLLLVDTEEIKYEFGKTQELAKQVLN